MRKICRTLLERRPPSGKGKYRCLDVGCGTGLWTQELTQTGKTFGIDFSSEAIHFCRKRGLNDLIQSSAEALPFRDEEFDVVTALGLIEHLEKDELFLRELHRVTKKGAHILVLTSAYPMLWSRHDEIVHHKRRYLSSDLRNLVQKCGFEASVMTHVNTILFLPIMIIRLGQRFLRSSRAPTEGTPDFYSSRGWINNLLYTLLDLEARVLKRWQFPAGVGLLLLARRGDKSTPQRNQFSIGRLWKASRKMPLTARLRIIGRYVICPFEEILRYLPTSGEILDVGCGDGTLIWMAANNGIGKDWTGTGIDHDPKKISMAKKWKTDQTDYSTRDLKSLPADSVDCVTVMDVLYTLPKGEWQNFLTQATRVLRPGGRLLIKEVVRGTPWKTALAYAEEFIALRVLRMTKGCGIQFNPVNEYTRSIQKAGAVVKEIVPLDERRLHSHHLFVAEKKYVASRNAPLSHFDSLQRG